MITLFIAARYFLCNFGRDIKICGLLVSLLLLLCDVKGELDEEE